MLILFLEKRNLFVKYLVADILAKLTRNIIIIRVIFWIILTENIHILLFGKKIVKNLKVLVSLNFFFTCAVKGGTRASRFIKF